MKQAVIQNFILSFVPYIYSIIPKHSHLIALICMASCWHSEDLEVSVLGVICDRYCVILFLQKLSSDSNKKKHSVTWTGTKVKK